jgi:hypothetical protein
MPEVDHGFRQEQLTNLAASDGDNMSAGCNGAQLSSRADLESDPDSRHHAAHLLQNGGWNLNLYKKSGQYYRNVWSVSP